MNSTDQQAQEQFAHAQLLQQQGRMAAARTLYEGLLRSHPNHFDALNALGVLSGQSGDFPQAILFFDRAIAVQPSSSGPYCNRGLALKQLRQLDAAVASFDQAIALGGSDPISHYSRAEAFRELGRLEQALTDYESATAINPAFVQAWFRRGLLLQQTGRSLEAIRSYDQVIAHKPGHLDAEANRALLLSTLHRHDEALVGYDRVLAAQPQNVRIHLLRSSVLRELNRFEEAAAACNAAIALDPSSADAYVNRGLCLMDLDRADEALRSYEQAIAIDIDCASAYFNRAYLLRMLGRFDAAAADYRRVADLSPDIDFLSGARLEANLQVCDWREFDHLLGQIVAGIKSGKRAIHPFNFLGMIDAPDLQREAARIWVEHSCPTNHTLGRIAARKPDGKLRIGYFSADYREHPTARLVAELIETHDRSRFEVIGFALGRETNDLPRQRLVRAFDRFFEIKGQSNGEVATLARNIGLDIAVDLGGHTYDSRTGIFALRAAPVQVNYLGYIGTMGADYIDYIVADRTVITPQNEAYFAEKIIYLPDTFQVNDRKREISARVFTRAELGLPPSGFVFCCFNSHYKILPATFAGWMRILTRVPGSVLMLVAGDPAIESNLRAEAARHAVDPRRLVFVGRLSPPDYLARCRAADLFLDTLPYNAGATASDALWAGLPVLTCLGKAFAGRAAASLLKAVDLPELITSTPLEYEDLAVALARDQPRIAVFRARLEENRLTSRLFDTSLFTRNLESAYTMIHARFQAGHPPDHIEV
jgi:predicted O-linked N-acetylglucosamine transferase (SPINDLY family)